MVAKALKRGEAAVRDYGGLLERKLAGLGASRSSRAHSAPRNEPWASPIHLVALLEPRHFLATASTRPAMFEPGTRTLGARSPRPVMRIT